MKFGLSEDDYQFISSELKKHLGDDCKVWCFGSRARGDHSKFSDLDLMVESSRDVSVALSKLEELFIDSNLPIKVDLVNSQNFANDYRENYLKDRRLFF